MWRSSLNMSVAETKKVQLPWIAALTMQVVSFEGPKPGFIPCLIPSG